MPAGARSRDVFLLILPGSTHDTGARLRIMSPGFASPRIIQGMQNFIRNTCPVPIRSTIRLTSTEAKA